MRKFTYGVVWRTRGRDIAETMFSYIENTLGLGKTAYPDLGKQTNYFAEHGLDLTTNNWWFSQIGTRTPLFNEEGTGVPNHLMYKMTDALALSDVLGRIDGNVALSTMVGILDAASADAPASLENARMREEKSSFEVGQTGNAAGNCGLPLVVLRCQKEMPPCLA